MRIAVLGINYKSSELHLRELLARASVRLFGSESRVAARLSIVLLSTCNRTEVYFSTDNLAETHSELLSLLREEIAVAFEHKLYAYFGADCFAHLCRVTAGLDSAIVAETEIQRQVKTAYHSASCDHFLKSEIHFLFQKSLKIGKGIRSSYSLPRGIPTLEKLIYELCQKMLGKGPLSLFFMGNSEINRKIIAYLWQKGIKEISLCTRGLHAAEELKEHYPLQLVHWQERERWQSADVLICGSNYPDYLITPEQLSSDCHNKIIFDLSLPRNVDPRLARHPAIRLFNIEELGNLIATKRSLYTQDLQQIEERLRKQSEERCLFFQQQLLSTRCSPTLLLPVVVSL